MRTQTIVMTGTGPTESKQIDLSRFRNGVGLICTVDAGATALYSVEVSGDNSHWNLHNVLQGKAASDNDSLLFPVNYVRLNGTVTSGSVTLLIVQAS